MFLKSVRRNSALVGLLLLACMTGYTEPVNGRVITVTAGTAIRITTDPVLATSILFQMRTGGTGRGYVLYAPQGVTCANGGAGTTLVGEIAPASATAPGGSLSIPSNTDPVGGIYPRSFCVDGSNSGDGINVSWNVRN